ncbi:hypothetical protein BH10ACT5_BH10ACT5_21980 [soil metagenome]
MFRGADAAASVSPNCRQNGRMETISAGQLRERDGLPRFNVEGGTNGWKDTGVPVER